MDNEELRERYLLEKAWSEYIHDWTFSDYMAAHNSLSSTETIDEFHQCEFFDKTEMKQLLSQEDFDIWKQITGR